MSVRDRMRLFEEHDRRADPDAQRQNSEQLASGESDDEPRPPLPTRPSSSINREQSGHQPLQKQRPERAAEEAAPSLPPRPSPRLDSNEIAPSLPPRPRPSVPKPPKLSTSSTLGLHKSAISPAFKSRPPIPPKSKSAGGNLVLVDESIPLIDFEVEGSQHTAAEMQILQPTPLEDNQETNDQLLLDARQPATRGLPPSPRRTPSPLKNLPSVPKVFRTVSEGAQTTLKTVQKETPKVVRTATAGTQKAFEDVHSGLKKVNVPVPKPFAQTAEDVSDVMKANVGKPGVCSRCAALPLKTCFATDSEQEQAYIPWSSPLSRIAFHARWCRLCNLILSVLYKPEHDPLLVPEVRDFIKPDWLKGVPLRKWVSEGYIHQDEYWPFGRSEHRYEGPTQVVGPTAEITWAIAKNFSSVGAKALLRSSLSVRPQVRSKDFKKTDRQRYAEGYRQGREHDRRYPISCIVMVTVSTSRAHTPGLLWVDLVGCSNKPGAEETVLSHFMLRAVQNSFSVSVAPDRALSYGHVLDPDWIDVSMATLWLKECESSHGTRCSEHGWAVAMQKPGFLRLLDIESLSIVVAEKPHAARYVALSYVWGGADTVKLRYANIEALSKTRGLEGYLSALPRTIIDAMEVVKSLGERYLWIDSLCILQEDSQESREQMATMDMVYGSALLTIVAAGGDSARAGISGVRPVYFAPTERSGLSRQASQPVAKIGGDVSVIAPMSSKQGVSSAVWNTRAWTFQERLLSRRMLVFANDEMVWHCRCTIAREDMPSADSGHSHPPLDWLDLKPQYLGIGTDPHWKDGSLERTRHGLTHVVRSGTFAEYARMIEQYSTRKMSYESDAVNALAGLLRIFSLCFQSECIFGLPTMLFDIALLWRPIEPLEKRSSASNFPSWSWAGWSGRVGYDRPLEIRRDARGDMMETEGIRPMLRYFTFDSHTGSLQPLNGTGRGLPLDDSEIPPEWEAHAAVEDCSSDTHSCRTPDLFDLDPRLITQLSNKNLLFWTSAADAFRIADLPPQKVDTTLGSKKDVRRLVILDMDWSQVGSLLLDGSGPSDIQSGLHEFIIMSEAQSSLLDMETAGDPYSYYLVMLVAINPVTATCSRLGLGRISKLAWHLAQPELKLVCLE